MAMIPVSHGISSVTRVVRELLSWEVISGRILPGADATGQSTRGTMNKSFAIVTGASSGIGLELATICAEEGFDLLVAADREEIQTAGDRLRNLGADVTVVETDLSTKEG